MPGAVNDRAVSMNPDELYIFVSHADVGEHNETTANKNVPGSPISTYHDSMLKHLQ